MWNPTSPDFVSTGGILLNFAYSSSIIAQENNFLLAFLLILHLLTGQSCPRGHESLNENTWSKEVLSHFSEDNS